eukprot:NODE_329_length_9526_cov_0.701708.p3 type:complete len:283 gc:universal NODE_329_length_9526_cov_0.701708:4364-3516(-)
MGCTQSKSEPELIPMNQTNRTQSNYNNEYIDTPPNYNDALKHYEIPESLIENHQNLFNKKSKQYESALDNLQIILLVDRSGSQSEADQYPMESDRKQTKPNWTKWDSTFMISNFLTESMFDYDKDGQIPVVFFGTKVNDTIVRNPGELYKEFQTYSPKGTTNLLDGLKLAISKYLPTNTSENALFIVITDGKPMTSDSSSIEQKRLIKQLILNKIAKVDPKGDRLNVLFIRVGDDPDAMAFLQEMDDCEEFGENVDTKSDNQVYQMGPKNTILNGIFEHLEK